MPALSTHRLLLGSLLLTVAVAPAIVACTKNRVAGPALTTGDDASPSSIASAAISSDAATSATASPSFDAASPSSAPPRTLTAAQCNRLFDEARREMAEVRLRTVTRCARHEDCMLANDTPCLPNAGSTKIFGIATSAESAWSAAWNQVRATQCREWQDGNCYKITPLPVATQMAYWPACVNRQCTAVTSPPR